jgi:putative phosphoesterase
MKNETIIGVISDTHGKLNNKVDKIFNGVDCIFHAGDIGNNNTVMMNLEAIAPIYAVRGNCDIGHYVASLPYELEIGIADIAIYMTHAYQCIDHEKARRSQLVIFGHNHYPEINDIQGIKYLNPGSATQGRRGSPPSVALVRLADGGINIEIVNL